MNPMFVSALQNSRPATRLLAGNWVLTLPRIPLELYAGMAYTSPIDSVIIGYNDAWRPEYINYPGYLGEVGVSLSVFNGFLRINRQLAATEALRPGFMNNTDRKPEWYEYFSWSIDLKRLSPHDLVRNFRM